MRIDKLQRRNEVIIVHLHGRGIVSDKVCEELSVVNEASPEACADTLSQYHWAKPIKRSNAMRSFLS